MSNLEKYLQMLQSEKASVRYEACEELRVSENLPKSALLALQTATNDSDPLVADAARRALLLHSEPEISDQSPLDTSYDSKNSHQIREADIESDVDTTPEWDYKVLLVNQQGKVEYIDGAEQGGEEVSGIGIIQIIVEILGFLGGGSGGGAIQTKKGYLLRIGEILPKLKAEGWEVESIEEDRISRWPNRILTTYTLRRSLEQERVYIDKIRGRDVALNTLSVIICPKCGTENAVDASNCVECRINLAWALDNYGSPTTQKTRKTKPKESATPILGDELIIGAVSGGISGAIVMRIVTPKLVGDFCPLYCGVPFGVIGGILATLTAIAVFPGFGKYENKIARWLIILAAIAGGALGGLIESYLLSEFLRGW